jgi:hypothetical protein
MADMLPQGEILHRAEDSSGHEPDHVSARGVIVFALGLVLLGVVVHFALGLVMNGFSSREASDQAVRPPMLSAPVEPPAPRLQGNPALDRIRDQERQLKELNRYGWVDRPAGIVHIPIDRAIDLLAERGLPEVKGDPGPDAGLPVKPEEPPAAKSAAPAPTGRGNKP